MAEIYAITVSTRYSDLLNIVIHQNHKFLKKWYIITDPSDVATIDVVTSANYSNIELLFFDFYKGAKFNFGGARRFGQEHMIAQNSLGKLTLMLDSDIYLPDTFSDVINSTRFEDNTLYGISRRYDYSHMSLFQRRDTSSPYRWAAEFQGFFQLFIQKETNLYKDSYDCSRCDLEFHSYFSKKIILPLTLYHLGKSGIHWQGRSSTIDFIIDI